ncbi:DUF2183 domain-containing protein [Antribacter sp. KLBMP9083]|uniref:DUF2183 domain-containing protein n=1 Tax=Antribacter soli TaxID=2910976 RepID=A0AA41UAV5_9MICO|nr:phosphatase domain-containing protein [Antribacter soli]MCF4120509.1 DUF2183 domain-containing protein [Antribacter soli]
MSSQNSPEHAPVPDGAEAPEHPDTQRPHVAAVVEDRVLAMLAAPLRRFGWTPHVDAYTGYGTTTRVRVLARVLLAPRNWAPPKADRRGFRNYLGIPAPGEPVRVTIGGTTADVVADRAGYVDAEIDVALAPGVREVTFAPEVGGTTSGSVVVIDDEATFGVVSDIDDTVMVTAVPRPLLAVWNTFLLRTSSRRPVPGMSALYRDIHARHPAAPFVYVSTGAWNTSSVLRRFLARHGFPSGPLLLTDWGPTNTGWFRSGPAHKDASIDRLVEMFPQVTWLLVGDDGQHDPDIYRRAVQRHPDRFLAVAIRRLTAAQQVLSHGAPAPLPDEGGSPDPDVPTVSGPDGQALAHALERVLGRASSAP